MDEQTPYYLAFSMCYGIGPMHFSILMENFGNPKDAFHAKESTLTPLLGQNLTKKFRTFRSSYNPIAGYMLLLKQSIHYIPRDSPQYPSKLRSISDPPIGLFAVGNTKLLNSSLKSIAIVGTRIPSSYGEEITKKFAFDLAMSDCIIVSGLAIGVDSFAHKAAIEAHGKTIAVLGCGVNNIPSSRAKLYKEIVASEGTIVSEFPPDMYVQKGFFVSRNRIVSGLSNGVLVIEGTDKSGTLITAKDAANQGRDVFAPPVPITSRLSQAPNLLLRNGALFVTCAQDILDSYQMTAVKKEAKNVLIGRKGDESVVLSTLLIQSLSPDELSRKTTLSIVTILTIISMLEIEGIVKKNHDGKYSICQP